MPNSATKKTASAHKYKLLLITGVVILLAAGLAFAWAEKTGRHPEETPIGTKVYRLERITDSAGHEKGLAGRSSLQPDHGMLFSYAGSGELCFWMKGMYFSLDIIWLDASKKVVHIEENVSPDTYPAYFCAEGRYAIELNAGEVEKSGLRTGQAVAF